jgi:hypothetical protein
MRFRYVAFLLIGAAPLVRGAQQKDIKGCGDGRAEPLLKSDGEAVTSEASFIFRYFAVRLEDGKARRNRTSSNGRV